MTRTTRAAAVLSMLVGIVACGAPSRPADVPQNAKSPFVGYTSAAYADPAHWLCLPDRTDDVCHSDMTATELEASGSRRTVRAELAKEPAVDCFYVYPTVDFSVLAGNHDDLHDSGAAQEATFAQAAHFREACALYVPLYRQITIGTYFRKGETKDQPLRVAYSDIADAFLHYMGHYNRGRKVVLLGHSQGAQMITRLMQQYFDDDPAMRAQLLLAIVLGGQMEVKRGQATGGTFKNIALCTHPGEMGCVVAYRSHRAQEAVEPRWNTPEAGNESACVNPATLDVPGGGSGGPRALARSFFPLTKSYRGAVQGAEGASTPFLMVRNFYAAECTEGSSHFRYLAVAPHPEPGDVRASPISWGSGALSGTTGLHVLDFQLAQGDLVDLVKRRAH